ncbi:cytochrome P450 [Hypoxylon trugodes]|uniref:cytochrome P450 n=1 Tax=Hypoxylon trugodes TaxID=326681 RepID=UPI002195638B|nr:cytochrome P450 [Hypoxylon trugodes]KAI1390980.1 cytochrome P450 [Hypoxylon trugodes]
MAIEETLSRPGVLAPVLLVIGYVLYQLFRPSRLPNLPVAGARPGEWFSLQRAAWRNAMDMKTATQVAYDQYRNQACIMPVLGGQNYVVLPASELQWLVDQPDTDIDIHEDLLDVFQFNYTLMDPNIYHQPAHHKIISTTLTRETGNLVPVLLDEIKHSVERYWGTDTENYREVGVYETLRRIIGHVTNRVFVGLPLCRNDELLDAGVAYAKDIPMSGMALRFTWKPLRPLVAPLVTLPNRIHTRQFYRLIRPLVDQRLRDYEARRADPETKAADKEPNDFLQWLIRQAKTSGDPYLSKPDTLAGRILIINFASIHTSSFAMTHVVLDIASRMRPEDLEELRTEIKDVLAQHGGEWNKRALAAMEKLDSTMRESQRLNSAVPIATSRFVVKKGGIVTPSGVRVPEGAVVCAPSYPVFHDPAIYPEPYEFRPFRFAEKRAGAGEKDEGNEKPSYVQKARQAYATTSPEYVAFGHGRHACPGRFFASSELKLMLAYVIMHYDIEPQKTRPENVWIGTTRMPPMKAPIRVKRRKDADV